MHTARWLTVVGGLYPPPTHIVTTCSVLVKHFCFVVKWSILSYRIWPNLSALNLMLAVNFIFASNKLLPHTSMDVRGDIDRLIRNYFYMYNLEPWTNINFLYVIFTVITARKRSLGQGNVFTPDSFYSPGGGVVPACNGQGVCTPECSGGRRCVWLRGVTGGVWSGVHPPLMVTLSGRYASYWNASLCIAYLFLQQHLSIVGITLSTPSGLKSEHCMHPGKVFTQRTLYIVCLELHPYLLSLLYQLLHKHRVIYWILS